MSFKKTLLLAALAVALGACSKVEPPAQTAQPATSRAPLTPPSVVNWGPQVTTPGAAANPLANGNTGMFFTLSRPVESGEDVQVLFGGEPLSGVVVDEATVTAELPVSKVGSLGQHAVSLKVGAGEPITVGQFVVAETLPPVAGDASASTPAPAATEEAGVTAPADQTPSQ